MTTTGAGAASGVTHPLDPLTAEEIRAAVEIVRAQGRLTDRARFPTVALREPPKSEVLAFEDNGALDRQVEFVILDKGHKRTFETVVSVTRGEVVSWTEAPAGRQPPVLWEEWDEAEEAVKSDPRFIDACRRRGIDDLEYVFVDPVSSGNFGFEHERGKRLVRGVAYWRRDGRDNGYAYPIEGVIPIVDLYEGKVAELWEGPEIPLPPQPGRYAPDDVGELRKDLKPLEITQPEGPSFAVDGNRIEWQKWSMRVTMHPREGLVLHLLSYDGRPILYRAALSEMVVPYGDTSQAHFWKAVFDAGEYGLGKFANSLERGCDCLGEIVYLDALFCDEHGEPMTIKNAVCLHEEDHGILWKHYDGRSEDVQVRRSRRLVISYIATVGNYEYGFYWYLYQDGNIEHEVKATGIMQTQGLAEGQMPEYGALIAPRLGAMHHQHWFNYRIDFTVDGVKNSVYEVDTEPLPIDDSNPYGNAMMPIERLIGSESEGARDLSLQANRYWKVVNPAVTNDLGTPVAYKLMPGGNSTLLCHPDSPMAKRARFVGHHLWVTRYDPAERYAAGEYPNQSDPDELTGIPKFQEAGRALENEDVVVWYSFGHTHLTRPEDWPVTPVLRIGFTLAPEAFFSSNPALDVPPPASHCRGASAEA
jgi:primary-amine oxidase